MSPERRREIARDIITLLGRIDWLVYALLKMSRLDAGTSGMKEETVSVTELTEQAYQLVAVSMDLRDIRWKCHVLECRGSGQYSEKLYGIFGVRWYDHGGGDRESSLYRACDTG